MGAAQGDLDHAARSRQIVHTLEDELTESEEYIVACLQGCCVCVEQRHARVVKGTDGRNGPSPERIS